MAVSWQKRLTFDPIPTLLKFGDPALEHLVHADLLADGIFSRQYLWELPQAVKLVSKQQSDGSWKYPGKTVNPQTGTNYFLLETFRSLRILIECYGFDQDHPAVQNAAEYIFSCQTEEGDVRGIIGNQYMPYYHGAILELLVKAGYVEDPRIKAGLDWLLGVRQEDGGWIVPAQAVPSKLRIPAFWQGDPVLPDRSLPHAHLATGMALRALAAHPVYHQRPETIAAGEALKERFFTADKYNDRKAKAYWLKFQYPFWWSSLLTALDSLSRIGFVSDDEGIQRGLDWFIANQEDDGLWPTGYGTGAKAESNRRWVGLAVCRVFSRWFSG